MFEAGVSELTIHSLSLSLRFVLACLFFFFFFLILGVCASAFGSGRGSIYIS